MIKNEKQYKAAKEKLDGWIESMNKMRFSLKTEDFKVYQQIHQSQVLDLHKEITDYELLKHGQDETGYFINPLDVGRWLIRQRIRSSTTQAELASRVHLNQAQISRDEDADFQNAPLMKLYEIASALGYSVFELGFFKSQAEMIEFHNNKSERIEQRLPNEEHHDL